MKLNSLREQNYGYLIHTWSDNALKGTVVNRAWPSLHGESLEITLTVPLRKGFNCFVKSWQYGKIHDYWLIC